MNKICSLILAAAVLFASCKKVDLATVSPTGEGIDGTSFRLNGPKNADSVRLNAATPSATLTFSWSAATPGISKTVQYSWVATFKTNGDINAPSMVLPAGNGATSIAIPYKQMDDILALRGVPAGGKAELLWSVVADNGDTKVMPNGVFAISITRFQDGATPFFLLEPVPSQSTVEINPGSTTETLQFNWTRSLPAKTTSPTRYRVWFYNDTLSKPLFSVASNNSGADSLLQISYRDFSDSLTAKGFTSLGDIVRLKWRVQATSGAWQQWSEFVNQFNVLREVKMFLVGGSTPAGWTPADAIQMIPDAKFPSVYYIYVYLNAGGGGLKFLNQKEWPGGPLNSTDWGMKKGAPGDLAADDEDNVPVPADGVYRVSIDMKNMKYYVQADHGRMGTVGDATIAGWNPPGVFPSQSLAYIKPNRFLGILEFKGGGAFKMIDGSSWPDGGGPVNQSKDFGRGTTAGAMLAEGEDNFVGPAAGMHRIIWDGTDIKNLKYELAPAVMKMVGDALTDYGVWNPGASPEMNYQGNGIWTLTLKLTGGKDFKFLAGADWGALDYEDAGTGKIKYEGGDNFKSPAVSGTYTVTIDEYKGTYKIE